jgi:sigma-B regulation protein RsbU (phosphoserine phosphatase)
LLLQIKVKEHLVGVLSVGPRRSAYDFSGNDKELLMNVAGQLAFVMENSKLVERMVEEESLRREIALASEVQQRLFPLDAPESAVVELAGFCKPVRAVGGDYYDFLCLTNEQLGVAVADVAGKGISAALLMSTVHASIRSQSMMNGADVRMPGSISKLVSTLNRLLCRSTGDSSYVTFFYAQIDETTRRLTYVNAGHNPPLLVRANLPAALSQEATTASRSMTCTGVLRDNCMRLTTGGPVLGFFETVTYEEDTVQLRRGDILLSYTDGVTEALSAAGEEFGEGRLCDVLATSGELPAREIGVVIRRAVQDWSRGASQLDDLTFVVLKMK